VVPGYGTVVAGGLGVAASGDVFTVPGVQANTTRLIAMTNAIMKNLLAFRFSI
jgi:hypothetical protein